MFFLFFLHDFTFSLGVHIMPNIHTSCTEEVLQVVFSFFIFHVVLPACFLSVSQLIPDWLSLFFLLPSNFNLNLFVERDKTVSYSACLFETTSVLFVGVFARLCCLHSCHKHVSVSGTLGLTCYLFSLILTGPWFRRTRCPSS